MYKNRQNKKSRDGHEDEARTNIKIEVRERNKRNGKENCRDDHRKRHIRMGWELEKRREWKKSKR